jgi:hypothetical protein
MVVTMSAEVMHSGKISSLREPHLVNLSDHLFLWNLSAEWLEILSSIQSNSKIHWIISWLFLDMAPCNIPVSKTKPLQFNSKEWQLPYQRSIALLSVCQPSSPHLTPKTILRPHLPKSRISIGKWRKCMRIEETLQINTLEQNSTEWTSSLKSITSRKSVE